MFGYQVTVARVKDLSLSGCGGPDPGELEGFGTALPSPVVSMEAVRVLNIPWLMTAI